MAIFTWFPLCCSFLQGQVHSYTVQAKHLVFCWLEINNVFSHFEVMGLRLGQQYFLRPTWDVQIDFIINPRGVSLRAAIITAIKRLTGHRWINPHCNFWMHMDNSHKSAKCLIWGEFLWAPDTHAVLYYTPIATQLKILCKRHRKPGCVLQC